MGTPTSEFLALYERFEKIAIYAKRAIKVMKPLLELQFSCQTELKSVH